MNIDKQEVKELALACDPAKCADEAEEGRRLAEFYSELTPEIVLALLAEIERLEQYAELEAKGSDAAAQDLIRLVRENRQLKAENEALRTGQAIKRLSGQEVREAFNGAYYQARETGSDGEQCRAGVLAVIEAAMAKEASHD
ncbi:hypothetical protein [Pseudomonas fulva]|uniref:hypothetical protein n=1 Tax=Pseudomonas fulva TaxID=47880 RepID=UPI002B1E69DE|nr:hypothetical protein [Pseudomonas fulva]